VINKEIREFPIIYANSRPIGKIAVGWGVHLTAADECKAAGIKKALIVSTGLKKTGIVDEINSILKNGGISTVVYNKVTSNPKDYEVMEGYKVFKEAECDGVVSVGGGSSHDCGKAIRAVACNDGRYIIDFAIYVEGILRKQRIQSKPITIPQISVNTTAGTGAENTLVAVITDTKNHHKQGIEMDGAPARAALIDPLLIRLMPAEIAAWTGIDAFTHALESFTSRIRSPYTRAIQLGTIQMVAENLREFVFNRMNHVACENMCWAESMGSIGMNFGGGGGIVHGLGGGVNNVTDCHHGFGNAIVLVPAERYNEPACPERFAEMAKAMGVDTRGLTTLQAADKWFDEVERLLSDLNIVTGHLQERFGITHQNLEDFARGYGNSVGSQGNPRDYNYEETLKILESLM
jgi:alcohol dehydrogenase class IV